MREKKRRKCQLRIFWMFHNRKKIGEGINYVQFHVDFISPVCLSVGLFVCLFVCLLRCSFSLFCIYAYLWNVTSWFLSLAFRSTSVLFVLLEKCRPIYTKIVATRFEDVRTFEMKLISVIWIPNLNTQRNRIGWCSLINFDWVNTSTKFKCFSSTQLNCCRNEKWTQRAWREEKKKHNYNHNTIKINEKYFEIWSILILLCNNYQFILLHRNCLSLSLSHSCSLWECVCM